MMNKEDFYDLRGDWSLKNQDVIWGSNTIPLEFRAPYIKLENILTEDNQTLEKKLIDICCGTGVHSISAAKNNFFVTGVDLSKQSIRAAKKLSELCLTQEKCEFVVADALDFIKQQPEEKFDAAIIVGSLYYFNRHELIPLIKKILKPNAKFIIIETNGSNFLLSIYRKIKNFISPYRDQKTLVGLLKDNEFQNIKSAFKYSELYYFDFFTLLGVFIPTAFGLKKKWHNFATKIDSMILKKNFAKYFAFKVLIRGNL